MRRPRAAVVGVGLSRLSRRDDIPLGTLAMEAVDAALADAAIGRPSLDGLTTSWNGQAGPVRDGVDAVTPELLRATMGLDLVWMQRQAGPIGPSLLAAAHAAAAGGCTYAVALRAQHNPQGSYGSRGAQAAAGPEQFRAPYGSTPVERTARLASGYLAAHGGTREQLGAYVVRNRRNALAAPPGYWHQQGGPAFALDDYLAARMISTPLGLLDCDLPVQAVGAFLLTSADRAEAFHRTPAYLVAGVTPSSLTQTPLVPLEEYLELGRRLGRHLWTAAGVGPADTQVADLYDGFSILTAFWADALGYCAPGAGLPFVERPTVALNPSGGSLGGGRLHGISQIMDAVLQVQGRGGARQVPGAQLAAAVTGDLSAGTGLVFSAARD